MNKYLKDDSGFNMVELLIVVALVSILSAIAFPTLMSQIPHFNLKSAVSNVHGELNAARFKAITINEIHRVNFTVGATSTAQLQVCGAPNAVSCTNVSGRGAFDFTTKADMVSPNASFWVDFWPTGAVAVSGNLAGTVDANMNYVITLKNKKDSTDDMLIKINKYTGRITVV